MDLVQKEHERLWKRNQGSKCLKDVQATIDLLKKARANVQDDPTSASTTLSRLHNSVKSSFEATNNDLKETYSGLNKYTRALDKLFKDKPLPTTEYDALSAQPALVNRAVAMHLLREGQFPVASAFMSEVIKNPTLAHPGSDENDLINSIDSIAEIDQLESGETRKQFILMYEILYQLKQEKNLLPAIEWARRHRVVLETRGSNLEFELCRLQFIYLFQGGGNRDVPVAIGRKGAMAYARNEFPAFQDRYMADIKQLIGAMAFAPNLDDSPYSRIFNNPDAWSEVADSFTSEFCALLGLAAESPLYNAATAGAIALPTLLKLQNIMKEKRTEWTSQNELPVEIPLPPSYRFHSIFVCPVSKEQTTDENPPMLMPCGHIIARESLMRLSKGVRFKCPYCPSESNAKDARKVIM